MDGIEDARGMAAADFDGDGDVDFVINNYNAKAAVHINELPVRSWIAVRVRGVKSNRDGIGAEVQAVVGGRRLDRIVGAGHSYASQFSLQQTIGLGDATGVDDLRVRWPDGRIESFGPFRSGSRVVVVEGKGRDVVDVATAGMPRSADGPGWPRWPFFAAFGVVAAVFWWRRRAL